MIWKNAQCELLLTDALGLRVSPQGLTMNLLQPRLPPEATEARTLFGAAERVLVLYADYKHYKAHIASICDYMLTGGVTCRFESLVPTEDIDPGAPTLLHALLQLNNADDDSRNMYLSGYPLKRSFPIALMLDSDEIDLTRTFKVLAFCVGTPVTSIRSPAPGDPGSALEIA
ncbi:hypothetical protein [Marilutibacter maris]|uniref:hypothetical protein n=1 Tax=Marilutibacter maris TaxID=1605891 RepID=UPI000DAA1302|nr:hypothetical protein [Lysobacter maris]